MIYIIINKILKYMKKTLTLCLLVLVLVLIGMEAYAISIIAGVIFYAVVLYIAFKLDSFITKEPINEIPSISEVNDEDWGTINDNNDGNN